MGILERLSMLLRAGAAAALAPAPDPRVTHLTSQQKQRALLAQVGAAREEVAAAKERLRATVDGVRPNLASMEEQARQELRAGREATARLALHRRHTVMRELQTLERQLAEVEAEEAALAVVEQRLRGEITAFAARRDVIKARYSAAEAQVRIDEAMAGVSHDFAELTDALHRAEETTERMQARATAIDRLVRSGHLDAVTLDTTGSNDQASEGVAADAEVERRLDTLRNQERRD